MIRAADFSHESSWEQANGAVDNLLQLVPPATWKKRAKQIRDRWPTLDGSRLLFRRHAIELHLVDLIEQYSETGQYFGAELNALDIEVHHFAQLMSLLKSATTETAARKCLLKHLAKLNSFRPLQFELDTLNYGLQKGFDVETADFIGSDRYDFKMTRNKCVVAVECKHIGGDHGFPIKYERAMGLCEQIVKSWQSDRSNTEDVVIEISANDAINDPHALSKSIANVLSIEGAKQADVGKDRFSVRRLTEIEKLSILELGNRTTDLGEHQAEVASLLGIDGSGTMFISNYETQLMLVSFTSQRQFNPGEKIFERLLDAAKIQLPEGLPGLLAVEFEEFSHADMEHHGRQTNDGSLIALSHKLFTRRPHVAGLIFTAGHRLYEHGQPWGLPGRKIIACANSKHPSYDDPDFRALV